MSSQALPGHARPLTFGVEFEFLVAKIQDYPDPHPGDERWVVDRRWTSSSGTSEGSNRGSVKAEAQDYITELLVQNGIPALSGHQYAAWDIEYVRSEMDRQGLRLSPNRVAKHAFWMVTDDAGIEMIEEEDVDGYGFVDVEIASRVLHQDKFDEVATTYSLVQNIIKTQVNSSCGLHIHIGIQHLSVDSIKKLVTLLMVVEDKGLFESICAPWRSDPDNLWCQRVSKLSRAVLAQESLPGEAENPSLGYHLPQPHGISHDLHIALTRIWNCITVKEIARETLTRNDWYEHDPSFQFSRRGGFALRVDSNTDFDINGDDVPADPTIEFRYKESTGSAREDYHWLQLCLHLVRCAEWSQGRFRDVMGLLSHANNLEDILNGLGVGGNEAQWWLSIEARHRRHPSPSKKTQFLEPENFSTSNFA